MIHSAIDTMRHPFRFFLFHEFSKWGTSRLGSRDEDKMLFRIMATANLHTSERLPKTTGAKMKPEMPIE